LTTNLERLHAYVIKVTDSPLRIGALAGIVNAMLQNGAFPAVARSRVSEVGTYRAQKLPDSGQVTVAVGLIKPVKTRWGSSIMEAARVHRLGGAHAMLIQSRPDEFEGFADLNLTWLKPFLRITAVPMELTVRFQVRFY
jgi:hypothetical protein